MNYKLFLLSLIAVIGMASTAFARTKSVRNTDVNVPFGTEQVATQVAEHEINVYGGNRRGQVRRSDPQGRLRPNDSASRSGGML